jgi:hypothetical protein
MAQEHLPSKSEALSSNPSTGKKERERENIAQNLQLEEQTMQSLFPKNPR